MKKLLKHLYLTVNKSVGRFEKLKQQQKRCLLVLCYHSVISNTAPINSQTNIAVSQEQFENHLKILRKDWHPISLEDVSQACYNNKLLPDFSVLVTFDDGFRNNYTLAAPLLKKYDIPAIVFITTGLIGKDQLLWGQEVQERIIGGSKDMIPDVLENSSHSISGKIFQRGLLAKQIMHQCKRLSHKQRCEYLEKLRNVTSLNLEEPWKKELYEFMSWDEVRDIRNYGVALGAHTVSHPILSSLEPNDLRRELQESKSTLEQELGEECFSLAYPNGGTNDFNEQVIEEAKNLGFQIGFNLCRRRNAEQLNPMSINRFCITRDLSLLEFERILTLD